MSSLIMQTVAALKAYGFIEVSGEKEKRTIRLTDEAVKIVRDHPDRQTLVKKAAISPVVYAELWDKYKVDGIPPDDILSHHLEWERGFNPKVVKGFIADFRDTIAFAKLDLQAVSDMLADTGGTGSGGKADTSLGGRSPDLKPPNKGGLPPGGPNMRTDTFTLEEGPTIALQYPSTLTSTSYQDFEDWMKIELRKIKRLIEVEKEDSTYTE